MLTRSEWHQLNRAYQATLAGNRLQQEAAWQGYLRLWRQLRGRRRLICRD